jgi:hypothetical protein
MPLPPDLGVLDLGSKILSITTTSIKAKRRHFNPLFETYHIFHMGKYHMIPHFI